MNLSSGAVVAQITRFLCNIRILVDLLVTLLVEPILARAILDSVFQPKLRFEKSHVSQPIINILKICKKHWIEDRIAMKLMTF